MLGNFGGSTQVPVCAANNNARWGTWGLPPTVKTGRSRYDLLCLMRRKSEKNIKNKSKNNKTINKALTSDY
jgi:hypothetical protein